MQGKLSAPMGASYLTALLAGLIATAGLMLVLSLATAAVVYLSPLSEETLPKAALLVDGLSLLAGGWLAARCGGRRGLALGAGVALTALALLLLLGGPETAPAVKIAVCLLCGMVGGIFGVR